MSKVRLSSSSILLPQRCNFLRMEVSARTQISVMAISAESTLHIPDITRYAQRVLSIAGDVEKGKTFSYIRVKKRRYLSYIQVKKRRYFVSYPSLEKRQSFASLRPSKSCQVRYTCSPQHQQCLRSDNVQRDCRNGESQCES